MTSRVVVPVIDLEQNDDPSHKVVLKGAKQLSTQLVSMNGAANSNEANFSFQPPSQNTVLDRRIDLVIEFELNLTGVANALKLQDKNGSVEQALVAGGHTANYGFPEDTYRPSGTVLAAVVDAGGVAMTAAKTITSNEAHQVKIGNAFAPRQFPLHSCIDTIDLTINGTHFSADPNKYLKAVQQYMTPEFREHNFAETCHHPDGFNGTYGEPYVFANYAELNHRENGLGYNPNEGRYGETPRGVVMRNIKNALNTDEMVKGDAVLGAAQTIVKFTVVEPLMISPLNLQYGEGMTNINNVDVSVKFRTNLGSFFSFFAVDGMATSAAAGILTEAIVNANTTVSAASTPKLRIRNYTPQDDIKIPNEIILPYHQPRRYETVRAGNLTANTPETWTTNNRRLDQIPEAVYVWVKRRFADETGLTTDGMCDLNNINITFGNQVGILSKHTKAQLRELAIENGCDLRSDGGKEARDKGYCLKLLFGKDIPLADNESPGTRGDYNIQISVVAQSRTTEVASLYEMYVNNGQVVISPNECRVQTGLLDLKDNIEAESMGHSFNDESSVVGAGLFTSLKKYAKKIPHLAKSVIKHAPAIVSMAKQAKDVYDDPSAVGLMGLAQSGRKAYKDARGGSIVGGSASGGSVSGGAYRSRRV